MKRSFLVVAVLFVTFGLVTPSAAQGVAKPDSLASAANNSPAAANLAKQAEKSEVAKLDTIATIRGMFFMTTNPNNPPDYQAGIYRSAPQTNDSLWFSIAFGDSLAGQELDAVTFYGARFDNDLATWEVHLFEVKDAPPADFKLYDQLQRWAYKAPKVRLGNLTYELNSPQLGQVEPYKLAIRPGFELAGRRFAFLVKRPPFNANSLRASENKFSAFAGIQLTARKASSGNALTGSLATNGAAPAQDWGSLVSWLVAGFVILSVITIWGIAYKRKAKKA